MQEVNCLQYNQKPAIKQKEAKEAQAMVPTTHKQQVQNWLAIQNQSVTTIAPAAAIEAKTTNLENPS